MARPKKTAKYDADDETIIAHFDQSMELYEAQKGARLSSRHPRQLAADAKRSGIDAVLLHLLVIRGDLDTGALLRLIQLHGLVKVRGVSVALLHRYL